MQDPVVAEVDVFLSQALSLTLHMLQYPLRPAHLPVEPGSVQSVRVRSESNQVQLQLEVPAHGENYSRSRGEAYARDADMAPSQTTPLYHSGLMDHYALTSSPQTQLSHRYVVGVLRDGELHLTPLRGIVQLRPSLAHLDQAVAGRRHGSSAPDPVATDGDTTESEGEEAKPVTVKFARRDVGRNRRVTWSELSSRKDSQEGWVDLDYCPLTSQQACDERKLLFASDDCPLLSSNLPPDVYLNRLCPLQDKEEEREPSEPPGGAVSLSKLKALPVTTQVHDLLTSTGVLTLAQLSSLLQCGRGQLPAYLETLQQHGVLVQGCWVVSSHTLYPSEMYASLRDARDYLLYCFSQTRCLARKDVAVLTKVPHEAVRQVVSSLTSGSGLEFKMATDTDFIHKYPHVVHQQEEKWRKRFEELKSALNLPKDLQKSPSGSGDSRKPASKKLKTSVAQ